MFILSNYYKSPDNKMFLVNFCKYPLYQNTHILLIDLLNKMQKFVL